MSTSSAPSHVPELTTLPNPAISTLSPTHLFSPNSHPQNSNLLSDFTSLHISCILTDHTLATFLPPFTAAKRSAVHAQWSSFAAEAKLGKRDIFYITATSRSAPQNTNPNSDKSSNGEDTVVAVVTLVYPQTETGTFRAIVEKLFVSPQYRKKGLARQLFVKLEETAKAKGRTLLMLDTEVGSGAENVYPRLGWKRLGVVPRYGISPQDGRRVDEVWFWKDLENEEGREEGGRGV